MAWVTLVLPSLVALCCLLEVRKHLLAFEVFAKRRNDWLDSLPNAQEFAAGLKEKVFVQRAIIEQRASLFPIADDHAYVGSAFRAHRGDAHGVLEIVHDVIFGEPVASLA